jgi:hypothetical protein
MNPWKMQVIEERVLMTRMSTVRLALALVAFRIQVTSKVRVSACVEEQLSYDRWRMFRASWLTGSNSRKK